MKCHSDIFMCDFKANKYVKDILYKGLSLSYA